MDLLKQPEILVFIAAMIVAMLSTIIGCVIWFVRLEGRLNYVEKSNDERAVAAVKVHDLLHARIDDVKSEHDSAVKDILKEMGDVKVQLAELIGYLKNKKSP